MPGFDFAEEGEFARRVGEIGHFAVLRNADVRRKACRFVDAGHNLSARAHAADVIFQSAVEGIGHGGAEAWLVGVLVQLQWILYALLADRGMLDQYFTSVPAESLLRLHAVLGSLAPESAALFLVERAAAFVFQVGLSVGMWHMLRERFRFTLPFMIVAHALIALPVALYQAQLIPLLAADAVYLVFGLIVMRALRRYFLGVAAAANRAARAASAAPEKAGD